MILQNNKGFVIFLSSLLFFCAVNNTAMEEGSIMNIENDTREGSIVKVSSNDDFNKSQLKIYFLYVGEADCFILTYKEEGEETKAFIIDAGEGLSLRKGKTDIIAKLKDIGIKEIEGFVLTHPHFDHFWNMEYIFENFTENSFGDKIKRFYYNTLYEDYDTVNFEDYISSIKYNEKVIETLKRKYGEDYKENEDFKSGKVHLGDIIYQSHDNNFAIKVVGPVHKSASFNDNSIVLLITYFNIRILLMADAGVNEEKDIVNYCKEKGIDISNLDMIKIGHHGHTSSSCEELIVATKPKDVICSTGPHTCSVGLFNWHERSSVMNRWKRCRENEWENTNVNYYSTQDHGDITAFTKEKGGGAYELCIKTTE